MRRIKFIGKKEIEVGKLHILPDSCEVFAYNEPVILTKKEFDLELESIPLFQNIGINQRRNYNWIHRIQLFSIVFYRFL
jgi:hypothetical protein